MIYLYGYLGIGVAILLPVLLDYLRTDEEESERLRVFLDAAHPERKKFSYRFVNHIVAPAVASFCLVAFWPFAVCLKIGDLLQNREKTDTVKNHEFAVTRADLLEHLTIQQIEQREMVVDPLNAVPALPFGHLHGVWIQFLADHQGLGELWSFSAHRETSVGQPQIRKGYVIVRDGVPCRYLMSVCKTTGDHS